MQHQLAFEFPLWSWNFEPAPVALFESLCGANRDNLLLPSRPITLRCRDSVEVYTNAYILCLHSPVFRAMLGRSGSGSDGFKECDSSCIDLPDKKATDVSFMVNLLSSGGLEFQQACFTRDSVVPAMALFREYQMVAPLARAVQFLKRDFLEIRPIKEPDRFMELALRYLMLIRQYQLEELESLILAEIKGYYVNARVCKMLGATDKSVAGRNPFGYSADIATNANSLLCPLENPRRLPLFDQLDAATQQKVLSVWSVK
ncbi:hypothetical protein BOX15_Mlig030857g1 [Macrostomum lignano]|uniref:BTB domain-containing protein n=1 Tax=Macrostomum lignano TaxID=282301 RepID=A0A267FXH5_9PLAT|nr:hypothetical protein BOX15_Mlig030857g1 [Macrostomum lignano]